MYTYYSPVLPITTKYLVWEEQEGRQESFVLIKVNLRLFMSFSTFYRDGKVEFMPPSSLLTTIQYTDIMS